MNSCTTKFEAQGRALDWRGVISLERMRNCIVKIMLTALTGKLLASVACHIVDFLLRLNPKWVLLMGGSSPTSISGLSILCLYCL